MLKEIGGSYNLSILAQKCQKKCRGASFDIKEGVWGPVDGLVERGIKNNTRGSKKQAKRRKRAHTQGR